MDCSARNASDARPFNDSNPKMLEGVFDLNITSLWENERGRRAEGQMHLLLAPDSLVYRIGPIWGAADINLEAIHIPIDKELLSSRNPKSPGLLWSDYIWHGLVLSKVVSTGGPTTWLEVEGVSSSGFWGEWKSDDSVVTILDEKGREIPYPHGLFCAVRSGTKSQG
jgi:hypothetical protein